MNESWICGGTLRVLRAETWLTVYRTIAIIRVQLQLVGTRKNVDICIIFDVFFRSNSFVHYEEGCKYFSVKVHWKFCLETSPVIDLLDQSHVKCNRSFPLKFQKYEIFEIFRKFQIFYRKFSWWHSHACSMASKLYESSRRKPGWRFTACFEYWGTSS